ncbi:MAG: DUF971 domain-containing protein [Anaerolineales bacterium]|nr:DUF971 domain-containing protein [Anaerolineales bacterium]
MKISEIIQLPVGLAIRWDDGTEALIEYHKLRDACPCANCSGESDLFGNKTFGIPTLKTDKTYQLNSFNWVGHYAIQFTWADRHDSGIYTLDLLRKLGADDDDNAANK